MKELKLHRILLIWLAGLILCTIELILIKLYITKNNISWQRVLSIPLFIFIVVPGVLASILILLRRIELWITNRLNRKPKDKNVIREARLKKVFGPHLGRWFGLPMIFCILFSAITAVLIRRQYIPEGDLSDDNILIMLLISIMFISSIISLSISSIIYTRLFISKKGKAKAIKYFINSKKGPNFLDRMLFRACGVDLPKYNEYSGDCSYG